jgi:L-aspartate oxidase
MDSFDVVVVGTGIAGLVAALTAAPRARVAVITKSALDDGATRWAQGGIAAALGRDDSPRLHLEDTITAGRGLCDEHAVRVLVEDGPGRVRELAEWGAVFDGEDDPGGPSLGREAAHSRNRIVHAGGDSTGRELERALVRRLRDSGVAVIEHAQAARLLADRDGRCAGVLVHGGDAAMVIGAAAVILATGGAGRLWRNTTNPAVATGEGVAMAYQAGAEVASMEFVQFHPTALALPGAPQFLLSEAMRGEGAHVIGRDGRRFLFDTDPLGELAGRDVVSRAIWERLVSDGPGSVLLDCRPLGSAVLARFPSVARTCAAHGIDITSQPVPIAPAAHYMIGGVRTDVDGATSVAGLFACGEVASSGVHGANRLASNSMLEGAVFGSRAARRALDDIAERPPQRPEVPAERPGTTDVDHAAASERLRDAMWTGCGVVREAHGLRAALAVSQEVVAATDTNSLEGVRLHQSATTAALVCTAALLREESRGAHTRSDFPTTTEEWHGVLVMHQQRGHRLDRNP